MPPATSMFVTLLLASVIVCWRTAYTILETSDLSWSGVSVVPLQAATPSRDSSGRELRSFRTMAELLGQPDDQVPAAGHRKRMQLAGQQNCHVISWCYEYLL